VRRYREDNQRMVKVRNYYVRRPQANRKRGLSGQEWREIGYALVVWLLVLVALFYALPIVAEGMR
jgi:hypothetical protein